MKKVLLVVGLLSLTAVTFYAMNRSELDNEQILTPTLANHEVAIKNPTSIPSIANTAGIKKRVELLSFNGKSIETDGLSIRDFLDKELPSARQGNAQVAYRVYQVEAVCGRLPALEVMSHGISDSDQKTGLDDQIASIRQACSNVSLAEIQERFNFLDQAIAAGNKDAIIDYRYEGPNGKDLAEVDANDPNVVAWKKNSNALLEVLASNGDRNAWSILSLDYQIGTVTPQDYQASIKYAVATTASKYPTANVLAAPAIASMAKSISAEAVRQAVYEGNQLAARYPQPKGNG